MSSSDDNPEQYLVAQMNAGAGVWDLVIYFILIYVTYCLFIPDFDIYSGVQRWGQRGRWPQASSLGGIQLNGKYNRTKNYPICTKLKSIKTYLGFMSQ